MGIFPVIMCGGSGTRLWPASRPSKPKQFIPLVGSLSTFQRTVLRVTGLTGARPPLVVANQSHLDMIEQQLDELEAEANILLEPEARDSAAAIAAAAAWIAETDPAGVAVIVASDHHIADDVAFHAAIALAVSTARTGSIVTLGMHPRAPSSAYGYIRPGRPLGGVREVEAFVEKPDAVLAQQYLEAGYLWNSGNFIASAAVLLDELETHAPEIASAARTALDEAPRGSGAVYLGPAFRRAPKISIDYAVMERTDRAAVLPVDFAWSDLGAWSAIHEASEHDEDSNALNGDTVTVDSRGCLIRAAPGLFVAAVGVNNLGIVVEHDAVLICDLKADQSIKAVVEHLRVTGRSQIDLPIPSTPRRRLRDIHTRLRTWLETSALPLWWTLGADHVRGGYHEVLALDGTVPNEPRRARVQARQSYVYATAGLMGWRGPWKQAALHGLDWFLDKYQRPDGLFRNLVSADGLPLEENARLYDQAFALLAMAQLRSAAPDRLHLESRAEGLLAQLQSSFGNAAGGFVETEVQTHQSNPHMHLLEAALAWIEAGGGPVWWALAETIVTLCRTRFMDQEGGFVREFFTPDWRPAPLRHGRILEPGHQFEWAWLLERWARLKDDADSHAAALLLWEAGEMGVHTDTGAAVDGIWDDFTGSTGSARLWPQTERLKASLILSQTASPRQRQAHLRAASSAAQVLLRYLQTDISGLWRDVMSKEGAFADQPAPASSLYHIVCAVNELGRFVEKDEQASVASQDVELRLARA